MAAAKRDRGRQLDILRDCQFPRSLALDTAKGISGSTAKLLLLILDQYGRGDWAYPSQELLCANTMLDAKTVYRATRALEAEGVLRIERRKLGYGRKTGNHYLILWHKLAEYVPLNGTDQSGTVPDCQIENSPDQSGVVPDCQKVNSADQSGFVSDQSGFVSDQSGFVSDQSVPSARFLEAHVSAQEPPPPPPRNPLMSSQGWRGRASQLRI